MDVCLEKYAKGLSRNSVDSRVAVVVEFFKFVGVLPCEAVIWQREHPFDYRFVDACYNYLDSLDLAVSSKKTYNGVVRGFFLVNRVPLPQDRPRFKSSKVPVVGLLGLEEFRKLLLACRLDYRCAFLWMFQSGSGCGELCYMNKRYADYVFREVKRGAEVLCFEMPGRKRNRNVTPYYTFVGRDVVDCLRQLFHSRGWRRDDVIFRTDFGAEFTGQSLHRYFQTMAFKLGLLKPNTPKCLSCGGETVRKKRRMSGGVVYGFVCVDCGTFNRSTLFKRERRKLAGIRYRIHTHEIRDLFRTEFHRAANFVQSDVQLAEFMMGHTIDSLGYNKIMKDRKYAEEQYRKVLPFLNILSENPRVVDRADVDAQLDAGRAEGRATAEKLVRLEKEFAEFKRRLWSEWKRE